MYVNNVIRDNNLTLMNPAVKIPKTVESNWFWKHLFRKDDVTQAKLKEMWRVKHI